MRRFATTWVGKLLGGLLLIGLAGFGISNVLLDLGSNTLAQVGSEEITTQQFLRAYQQQMNTFSQQTGQVPTAEQALQYGIPTAVIAKLASDAAINQFALQQGIGVSDTRLAKMVREDPSFAGNLGTFDRAAFTRVLQQNGYTEAEYFDLQTRAARRQQIAIGLFAGTGVPEAAKTLLNRYRYDKRTVEYFTLNSTSLPTLAEPTEDDLKTYLSEHQTDFRTREARTVDVLYLTPEILAQQADYQPTDEQVQAEYDRTKDQLVTQEKRHIQQVALPDAAAEKIFTDAQAAGTGFADALAASGLKATDFGLLAKAQVQDAALADAAFGLAKAGDFTIIAGVGGKRAVGVTEIQPGGQTSFEDARDQIASNLAVEKARAAYADVQDQIEELRAAFKPLKDIADRFKLPVETVAVTQDGTALSSVPGLPQENRTKVVNGIFDAEEGKLAPTVTFASNQNLWFDLTHVEPARDQTLDEVHDAVESAWTAAKTDEALQAEVANITKELDGGKSFQDVAAEYNQFATISQPITRDGDGTSVLNQQVATQIFGAGPDSHGSVIDGDGEYVVYHVVDVTPADEAPAQNITDFLLNSSRDALYAQFIGGLRDEAGIKINQKALSQALNLDTAQ